MYQNSTIVGIPQTTAYSAALSEQIHVKHVFHLHPKKETKNLWG